MRLARHLNLSVESHPQILNEMKVVKEEPDQGLWFRHESPYKLLALTPMSYEKLKQIRPDYNVEVRKETENKYRALVAVQYGMSFLYATIVGSNKMESPLSYPGYTYYFQLTDHQIEHCIFDVVDKRIWMEPTVGKKGFELASSIWKNHQSQMHAFEEEELGLIDPRIEVIIPFAVTPTQVVLQEEDR